MGHLENFTPYWDCIPVGKSIKAGAYLITRVVDGYRVVQGKLFMLYDRYGFRLG